VRVIRHVVLMSFHDPADAPEARRLLEPLASLPSVRSLEVGLDVLRTDASADLFLVSTHDDLAGLTVYQQHPDHQEVLAWLRPRLRARSVVDAQE
jgi:hypothetical protein